MSLVTRTIGLPRGRPFTAPDLARLPDDGNRYELLDGVLLVTPAPSTSHQVCPSYWVQPDLIVARTDAGGGVGELRRQ